MHFLKVLLLYNNRNLRIVFYNWSYYIGYVLQNNKISAKFNEYHGSKSGSGHQYDKTESI